MCHNKRVSPAVTFSIHTAANTTHPSPNLFRQQVLSVDLQGIKVQEQKEANFDEAQTYV